MRLSPWIFPILLCQAAQHLMAVEIPITMHGSASQTYLRTTSHDFLIKDSSEGSFEYTEFNLNAHHQYKNLGIGAQVLVRDFGDEGNFEPRLDWGYGDYVFNEAFGVKAGKIKLPIGLYSESRDVDSSRMEILFPQVFNPEDYRDAAEAYQGVGLHGNIAVGDNDLLYYHLFWGNNNVHDDFFLVRDTNSSYQAATGGVSQGGMSLSADHLRGGHLVWNMDRLGLRFSYNLIDYSGYFNVNYRDLTNGSVLHDDKALLLDIKWHIVSTEWTHGPWSVSAESLFRKNKYTHSYQAQRNGFPRLANNEEIDSWYITARRQWNLLGCYLSYGQSDYELGVNSSPTMPDYLKELSGGLRYDFSKYILGKIQLTHYWGMRATMDANTNSDKNWDMITARLTFHF